MDLFKKASELMDSNTPFAMASIVSSSGSTPRENAKMLVLADGACFGTIGGGLVEDRVVLDSRQAIAHGRSGLFDYALDSGKGERSLPMICGGAMQVFIEVFAAKHRLLVVGGGHVGLEIAKLASSVGYRVAVVDERPDFVTRERFPMACELYVDADFGAALSAAPVDRDTCVVIATHASDDLALRRFISAECRYLGLLGSRRKVAILMERLRAEGVADADLARVRAPIGLDLGAETPEEIAVSVVAEVMAVVSGSDGAPLFGRTGELIVVRGAGDLATGVIVRLRAAGFRVAALEIEKPTSIRRTVCLSEAVYDGQASVEGVAAKRCATVAEARTALAEGVVPVLVDPDCRLVPGLSPAALVDATLAKRNTGVARGMARAVVALGPGFTAGGDVDAVIETQRGHDLGRVILSGGAAPDTGVPGEIGGKSAERVLRAPIAGVVEARAEIGSFVKAGEAVIAVRGAEGVLEVRSAIAGIVRGAIRPGLEVPSGLKIADVDPRGEKTSCFSVSDKARAVAGGVLEAVLRLGAVTCGSS